MRRSLNKCYGVPGVVQDHAACDFIAGQILERNGHRFNWGQPFGEKRLPQCRPQIHRQKEGKFTASYSGNARLAVLQDCRGRSPLIRNRLRAFDERNTPGWMFLSREST
jgi:hypothetical protein